MHLDLQIGVVSSTFDVLQISQGNIGALEDVVSKSALWYCFYKKHNDVFYLQTISAALQNGTEIMLA